MGKRVGIFGNGYWSKIIQSKLTSSAFSDIDIVFIADSKSDHISHLSSYELDWAIVASPNVTHYEIVEACLREGIAVFCEKPLVSHPNDALELYALAKKHNAPLYVDDVFMWRNDIKDLLVSKEDNNRRRTGRWVKNLGIKNPKRCLNDFLYHHLYLIGELLKFPKDLSMSAAIEQEDLRVTITSEGKGFNVTYGLNHLKAEHTFLGLDLGLRPNDALEDMLRSVFKGTADFTANQQRTLWATEMLYKIKQLVMPSVGVIGGGIFGSTAAILLADEGCNVTLYEKADRLLAGATAKNQLRLHRGYHYPRSKDTALSSKHSDAKFKSFYRSAVDGSNRHLYALAKEGSMTSEKGYEQFLHEIGLEYKKLKPTDPTFKLFNKDVIAAIYEVEESLYNPAKLREILEDRCLKSGVNTKLGRAVDLKTVQKNHAFVIGATYSNPLSTDQDYQFEVCEKPIVKLPAEFKNTSILILDGPFIGIDPLPGSKYHVLDSVKDAIHLTNIGKRVQIPDYLESYVDSGLIAKPEKSRYNRFIKTGQRFYQNFTPTDYQGSYFVVRAVLPYREHDDARPSTIRQVWNNTYEIFSGKVSTAPHIGQRIVENLLYPD